MPNHLLASYKMPDLKQLLVPALRVQTGAFTNYENAENMLGNTEKGFEVAVILP